MQSMNRFILKVNFSNNVGVGLAFAMLNSCSDSLTVVVLGCITERLLQKLFYRRCPWALQDQSWVGWACHSNVHQARQAVEAKKPFARQTQALLRHHHCCTAGRLT